MRSSFLQAIKKRSINIIRTRSFIIALFTTNLPTPAGNTNDKPTKSFLNRRKCKGWQKSLHLLDMPPTKFPLGNTGHVYSCFVVDDDEVDRLSALSFCRRYPFLKVTGAYASALAALEAARIHPPDVLLLDIDMEDISGLELRERLLAVPACIFITAYPDYAVESFDKAALDFLVKPISADRFALAMERLESYLILRDKAALLDYTLGGDAFFIKEGHSQVKILLHEILYLEALKDYTGIVTATKKYCVLSTLTGLLEQKAFSMFARIHRSYAVQKNYITKITTKEVFVKDIALPLGGIYKASLNFINS
jgi:two-component system, LytTR family, response regulator